MAAAKKQRVVDFMLLWDGPEDLALDVLKGSSLEARLRYSNKWTGGSVAIGILRRANAAAFIPTLLEVVRARPAGAERMAIDIIGGLLASFDGSEIAETLIAVMNEARASRP